jgi:photosystem II stability/assembly factor-like uncharacterized protein
MNFKTVLPVAIAGLACAGHTQTKPEPNPPFTLNWTQGKCVGCKITADLGEIQFISRTEAWAVGCFCPPPGAQGLGDYIAVHTQDAGRTWREVRQTYAHAGAPAFSFLDARRGWIAWWSPAGDPKIARTRDGGWHWQGVSREPLQKVRFFDDTHGYGAEVTAFLRTDDGGRTWVKSLIPHLGFIDRMSFVTPNLGWIAGTDGKEVLVFRTTDGGRNWDERHAAAPKELAEVRDLFFLDEIRGWLIAWRLSDAGTHLLSTTDGGKNWAPVDGLLSQRKGKWAGTVRFVSDKVGFLFEDEDLEIQGSDRHSLAYTVDGGAHWQQQSLPYCVYDCRVFGDDLLCSFSVSVRLNHLYAERAWCFS